MTRQKTHTINDEGTNAPGVRSIACWNSNLRLPTTDRRAGASARHFLVSAPTPTLVMLLDGLRGGLRPCSASSHTWPLLMLIRSSTCCNARRLQSSAAVGLGTGNCIFLKFADVSGMPAVTSMRMHALTFSDIESKSDASNVAPSSQSSQSIPSASSGSGRFERSA